MFCYQCEQTMKGEGCQVVGNCGKDETTADLQDLLIHAVKGISMYAHRAQQLGATDAGIDAFTVDAIYATVTNVNFDPARIVELIHQAIDVRYEARKLYENASVAAGVVPAELGGPAVWKPAAALGALLGQSQQVLLPARFMTNGKEIANLQELVLYGLKGVSAYAAHALALGAKEPANFAKIHEILDFLTYPSPTAEELLGKALAVGELNFGVMEVLDKAHTEA
jgi:hydroxylamine reductase